MSSAMRLLPAGGVPGSSSPHTTKVGTLIVGSFAMLSKLRIAAAQPKKPAGVVPAMVAWICCQRWGLRPLNLPVNQRSIVASAKGATEFAFFTASTRGAHISLAPGGVCGEVSQNIADLSLAP